MVQRLRNVLAARTVEHRLRRIKTTTGSGAVSHIRTAAIILTIVVQQILYITVLRSRITACTVLGLRSAAADAAAAAAAAAEPRCDTLQSFGRSVHRLHFVGYSQPF